MNEIDTKRKEAKKLAAQIVAKKGLPLTFDQTGRLQQLEDRMEFRLKELSKESDERQEELANKITLRHEEIKIESMEKVLEIINEKKIK